MEQKQKLEKEIEKLEKQLAKNHFGGIVDQATRKRDEKKLGKLKKELEALIKK